MLSFQQSFQRSQNHVPTDLLFRDIDGISAKSIEQHLGYGEAGGYYAEFNDGNPAWEDVDFDMWDSLMEVIWHQNDQLNNKKLEKYNDQEMHNYGHIISSMLSSRLYKIIFRTQQCKQNRYAYTYL